MVCRTTFQENEATVTVPVVRWKRDQTTGQIRKKLTSWVTEQCSVYKPYLRHYTLKRWCLTAPFSACQQTTFIGEQNARFYSREGSHYARQAFQCAFVVERAMVYTAQILVFRKSTRCRLNGLGGGRDGDAKAPTGRCSLFSGFGIQLPVLGPLGTSGQRALEGNRCFFLGGGGRGLGGWKEGSLSSGYGLNRWRI